MDRIITNEKMEEDKKEEFLRPQRLNEYIGQKELKINLEIFINAAKKRGECLDHVLLYGPPGLGKTTLACVIANEMNSRIHITSGPSLEKIGDLATLLSELEEGDILFIDEIHRIPKVLEESLYTAMEDFRFSIVLNRENGGKVINIDLPPFTLIGATTRAGNLSSPLRARFGISEKLSYYDVDELQKIVLRTSRVLNTSIDEKGSFEIAKRSRGTPRIANRLYRRVRDFANYYDKTTIDIGISLKSLNSLRVDSIGLDDVDVRYLLTLINRFKGGPVGLETLSSAIGEDIENLEDVYEPYLLQIGFIDRTPRGRVANEKAYLHLNIAKNRNYCK